MHTLVDCVGLAEPNLAWHYCALDNLECHPKDSDVSLSQEPNVSSIPTAIHSNSHLLLRKRLSHERMREAGKDIAFQDSRTPV